MAEVRARIKELIPTAKYANVEIGLELVAEATELCDGSPKGIEEALERAYDICDEVLQKKREPIIDELDGANS